MTVIKVLVIVEDELDMRNLIQVFLSADPRLHMEGEASNARDAIELARTNDPGLIILDHTIDGDIMGLEAASLLKEVAPKAVILLFSAYDLEQEAEKEPAIDGFLSKSEIDELVPTVQRMLGLEPL